MHRGEKARYSRGRNVGTPYGGCTLVFSGFVSFYGLRGRGIRLSSEARVKRKLRASIEMRKDVRALWMAR